MGLRSTARALAILVLLGASGFTAQSELVIVREGSKEYHRPGCEVIKDGKQVLALTRAQASARGLTAHEACDPSKAPVPPDAPGDKKDRPQPDPAVFVDGTRYYHKKDCTRLGRDPKKMELDEAGRKYWPCPSCKPPIRKRK